MNERIIQARKSQGLTQDALAKLLKISKSYVSQIESGQKVPSDRLVDDICQVLNVNAEWLKSGGGEMKVADKLSEYLGTIPYGDDDFIRDLVESYMELDSTSKEALKKLADNMLERKKRREQ